MTLAPARDTTVRPRLRTLRGPEFTRILGIGDHRPALGRFKERGRAPVWANPRFVYIGRSERNLDLRVLYFDGAKLKSPQG